MEQVLEKRILVNEKERVRVGRVTGLAIKKIPIDSIDFNPYNLYGVLKKQKLIKWLNKSFTSNMNRYINPPIVCRKDDESDRFLCIAGEGRIIAASLAGASEITCQVWETMDDYRAMKTLAEDNATQVMLVPAARANEVYWYYRVVFTDCQDHEQTMQHIQAIYSSMQHIYEKFVVPGWLLAPSHSSVTSRMMELAGPRRENLSQIRKEQSQLIKMRQGQMYILALPFWPVLYEELLRKPEKFLQDGFDALLQESIDRELMGMAEAEFLELLKPKISSAIRQRVARLLDQMTGTSDLAFANAALRRIRTFAHKRNFLMPEDAPAVVKMYEQAREEYNTLKALYGEGVKVYG